MAKAKLFHPDPRILRLEDLPTLEIVEMFVYDGFEAMHAVARCKGKIAEASDTIVTSTGRLIYEGAGTPGRLAKLDEAELPPTFGIPPNRVITLMAGGSDAFGRAKEGAEDDEKQAIEDLRALNLREQDVVCGIAASGTTPYVLSALQFARKKHAATIFITGKQVPEDTADTVIHLDVGPELIDGSTRLKAGTAQTQTLKTISSIVHIKRGRTYRGLMVDMKPTNKKLLARAVDMIERLTGVSESKAGALLVDAMTLRCETHGPVKIAAVMFHRNMDPHQAIRVIDQHDGHLHRIIGDIDYTKRGTT